jgi:hypothetical protein
VDADRDPRCAAQVLGYDKSVYVNSRKIHCIWAPITSPLSSEPNNAMVCYSYAKTAGLFWKATVCGTPITRLLRDTPAHVRLHAGPGYDCFGR